MSHDLRLAVAAGALWVGCAACVARAPGVAWVVSGAGAVVLASLLLCQRRCRYPSLRLLAVVVGGVMAGAVVAGSHAAVRDASPVASAEGRTVDAVVVLTDDPRLFPGRWGPDSDRVLVPGTLRAVDGAAARGRVRIRAPASGWDTLLPGQRVAFSARVEPDGRGLTAALLVARDEPTWTSPVPWAQAVAGDLRAGLRDAASGLPPSAAALLPGLVVGDTSGMSVELREDFRAAGLTHLVAVSGANCVIVTAAMFAAARLCGLRPRTCALLAMLALLGFVVLARPSPSVLRAGLMGLLALVAVVTGRARPVLPALAATVLILVVVDPALSIDPGFVLSVVATLAIVLLAPRWTSTWSAALARRLPPLRGLAGPLCAALAVAAAAQAAAGPVVAGIGGGASLVAIAANLLVAPAVPPATVLGVLAAVVSPASMAAAEVLAWLASWPVRWIVWVGTESASMPAAHVGWPAGWLGGVALAMVTAVLWLVLRSSRLRRPAAAATLAVALLLALAETAPTWLRGWPPRGWSVVMCDVGQGDATVLAAGPGSAVVVDAGADPDLVDRCLDDLGVREVPVLALSHHHLDHVGGLPGVLEGRDVREVWRPGDGDTALPDEVRAALTHVPVGTPGVGEEVVVGDLILRLLGPVRDYAGTRSDANNASLVLHADAVGVSVLLPGDVEGEAQRDLVRAAVVPDVDVLKVPHHGSRYQEEDFLTLAAPEVALVGVGANSYGHPDASTLGLLREGGAEVLTTADCGDIAVGRASTGSLVVTARACDPRSTPSAPADGG